GAQPPYVPFHPACKAAGNDDVTFFVAANILQQRIPDERQFRRCLAALFPAGQGNLRVNIHIDVLHLACFSGLTTVTYLGIETDFSRTGMMLTSLLEERAV